MSSVNKVILIGNVGKDPEVRYTPAGKAVCTISLATSHKSGNGEEKKEETAWHRVVFYERLADVVGEYVRKGAPIYVEGRLKYREFADKDGNKRNITDVVAFEMKLLGGRADRGDSAAPAKAAPKTHGEMKKAAAGFDDMDSDIPW